MMHTAEGLNQAMSNILDKIDVALDTGGYSGIPIKMYITGQVAIEVLEGGPPAQKLDAWFSRKLLIDHQELLELVLREDGVINLLYFNSGYNPDFDLSLADETKFIEWKDVNTTKRHVTAFLARN